MDSKQGFVFELAKKVKSPFGLLVPPTGLSITLIQVGKINLFHTNQKYRRIVPFACLAQIMQPR